MTALSSVDIKLDHIKEGLSLGIEARRGANSYDALDEYVEFGEARFQLVEGCFYDYELNDPDFTLEDPFDNIVLPHKKRQNMGTIAPNIYVGTLEIPVVQISTGRRGSFLIEVQSLKSGYRDDYRDMLEFITERCTELLLQSDSPVYHQFEVDYAKDCQTLYQRFAFIKSILNTDEFSGAVHRVTTMPVTRWTESLEGRDVRNAKRFSNANIKEILKDGNRVELPDDHYLRGYGLDSLPQRVTSARKCDSVDTPENRFVKHALETFLFYCFRINRAAVKSGFRRLERESAALAGELESYLQHGIFRAISRPVTLNLNSPVLQRREGYREILRVWLMFDLAAKLIWRGGDDVYSAGKKDIAVLYEYWLFFVLLDLFGQIFQIEPASIGELISLSADGLNLNLKQGKSIPLRGVFDAGIRKLNVIFSYNRTFSARSRYPAAGSWTTSLRPDYTLSMWPFGITEDEAERQELIVHVHFDAKYKVENFVDYLRGDNNEEGRLDVEKVENRRGIYKNADLLKMHTYKDAIRRTGGAYVLYPGTKHVELRGFHEIIPGLGAFPVRPSRSGDTGISHLKGFIVDIIAHFINRASQRERMAYKTYDVYQNPPDTKNLLNDPLPEAYNSNRALIPDETYVLVGYYKSPAHYEWIKKNRLYNFRMDSDRGSLIISKETVGSRYLLLHTQGDNYSGKLWQIKGNGPMVYSRAALLEKGYPNPAHNSYLVYELEEVKDEEFKNIKWDFRQLENYSTAITPAHPFTTTLTQLMSHKVG